jgi:hypothetical protein
MYKEKLVQKFVQNIRQKYGDLLVIDYEFDTDT